MLPRGRVCKVEIVSLDHSVLQVSLGEEIVQCERRSCLAYTGAPADEDDL